MGSERALVRAVRGQSTGEEVDVIVGKVYTSGVGADAVRVDEGEVLEWRSGRGEEGPAKRAKVWIILGRGGTRTPAGHSASLIRPGGSEAKQGLQ